jgi:hypothetical protein
VRSGAATATPIDSGGGSGGGTGATAGSDSSGGKSSAGGGEDLRLQSPSPALSEAAKTIFSN